MSRPSTVSWDIMDRAKQSGAEYRAQEAWKKYVQETKAWEGDMADYGSKAGMANLAGNIITMAGMAAIPGLGMVAPAAGASTASVAGTTAANVARGVGQKEAGNFFGNLLQDWFVGDAPTPPPEFGTGEDLGYYGRRAFKPYELQAAGDPSSFQNQISEVDASNEEMATMIAMMNFGQESGAMDWLKNLLGWGA